MFDSQLGYFLFLLFFFWVLEGIGKAMQKKRQSGQSEEGEARSTPTTAPDQRAQIELPTPRSQPSAQSTQRPRTLWEEIAEIARQQAEQQRLPTDSPPASQKRQGAPIPAERPRPAPRRAKRSSEFPPPTPTHGHQAPSRWEEGLEREAAARGSSLESAAPDERRSDRWLAGARGEGSAAEPSGSEASGPEEVSRYDETDSTRRRADQLARRPKAPAARPAAAAPVARTALGSAGLERRTGRPPVPALAAAPAAAVSASELDLHNLRGASRAELRRLLILSEVLGPPIVLREGHSPDS
jgi:hypothetical protein